VCELTAPATLSCAHVRDTSTGFAYGTYADPSNPTVEEMNKVIRDANAAAAAAAIAIADANAAAATASVEGENKGTLASSTDAAKATMCADLVSLVDACTLIVSAGLLQHTGHRAPAQCGRACLDGMLRAFENWLPRWPPPWLQQPRPLKTRRPRPTPTP